ncbi:hypothetical protein OB919_18540 [Halobacteria archaeon AArc-curdl1]|uniref:Uncharacterized protein n=1 Tax=Natronosalvus hydrolyticus TaxID=2979988 RepID=A0AAP2ZBP4_9EURY|nr:hypothetical protein [Halobacteria archaeon AArc-curdl1]
MDIRTTHLQRACLRSILQIVGGQQSTSRPGYRAHRDIVPLSH